MLPNPQVCQYYQLSVHRYYEHKVGSVRFLDTRLSFRGLETILVIVHILDYLWKIMENLVAAHTVRLPGTDKIRFVLQAEQYLKAPISIPFVFVADVSVLMIMDAITRVLQSAEKFRLDEGVIVSFIHLPLPIPASGGGTIRLGTINRPKVPLPHYIKARKSTLLIQNADNLCVAHALRASKLHTDGALPEKYNRAGNRQQTNDAKELHRICGIPEGACGLQEIRGFAEHDHFKDYVISVFTVQPAFLRIYCSAQGESRATAKKMFLLLHDGHCDVLTSVTGFSGFKYYCHLCGGIYQHKASHVCKESCQLCKHPKCANWEVKAPWSDRKCQKCRRFFRTQACEQNHQREEVCKEEQWCDKCNRRFSKKKFDPETGEHPNCGLRNCRTCRKHVDPNCHPFCYVQPYRPKKKKGDTDARVAGGPEADNIEDVTAIDLYGGDFDEADWEHAEQVELASEERQGAAGGDAHCYYFDI